MLRQMSERRRRVIAERVWESLMVMLTTVLMLVVGWLGIQLFMDWLGIE